MSDKDYLTDGDLAELLGISIQSLRNKVSAGERLPPRIKPPGCRNRLWPKRSVYDWLDKFMEQDQPLRRFSKS